MTTAVKRAAKKVKNWNVNGVELHPYEPSLQAFADALKEELWDGFIKHLNESHPLGKRGDEPMNHVNFIGSIEKYKKIYMES